ncbi:hypothetical protein [Nostoc sp. UHCC 0302]|uniref:hypothetical protein n=1 Tax=Nostoc sp. UHCC 0302 TaxID=3134896 RepID=UPI00311CC218
MPSQVNPNNCFASSTVLIGGSLCDHRLAHNVTAGLTLKSVFLILHSLELFLVPLDS